MGNQITFDIGDEEVNVVKINLLVELLATKRALTFTLIDLLSNDKIEAKRLKEIFEERIESDKNEIMEKIFVGHAKVNLNEILK